MWVSSLREFGITGSDPSPIPQLDCTGSETELIQCTIHQSLQCSDADDAGIRCLGKYQLL